MNDSPLSLAPSTDEALLVDDENAGYGPSGPDLISDDEIDYHAMIINTQPDKPGGRIVFSSDDYATEEETMAAMEALFMTDMEEDDDECLAKT